MNLQQCLAITLAAQMSLGMAAAPAIGVATARGAFRVNDAAVKGNGTLFAGARVETAAAPGDLSLSSGQRLTLSANSTAQVFSDHLVLERGESRIGNAQSFSIEARSLKILADETGGAGRVSLGANDKILVASNVGRLRVLTASGIPLATVSAGRALEFDTRSGNNPDAMRLTGRVSRREGKLVMTDEATDLTVELRDGRITKQTVEKNLGKRVEIAGLHVPNSVPIALQVQSVGAAQGANTGATAGGTTGATGGTAGAGTGAGAGGAGGGAGGAAGAAGAAGAGAGAGAGISTAAIVAGVLVTGATVGTVVGVTRGGDDDISK